MPLKQLQILSRLLIHGPQVPLLLIVVESVIIEVDGRAADDVPAGQGRGLIIVPLVGHEDRVPWELVVDEQGKVHGTGAVKLIAGHILPGYGQSGGGGQQGGEKRRRYKLRGLFGYQLQQAPDTVRRRAAEEQETHIQQLIIVVVVGLELNKLRYEPYGHGRAVPGKAPFIRRKQAYKGEHPHGAYVLQIEPQIVVVAYDPAEMPPDHAAA